MVFFKWKGKTVLKGLQSQIFLVNINVADEGEAERVMAKITGNFKHGNEK